MSKRGRPKGVKNKVRKIQNPEVTPEEQIIEYKNTLDNFCDFLNSTLKLDPQLFSNLFSFSIAGSKDFVKSEVMQNIAMTDIHFIKRRVKFLDIVNAFFHRKTGDSRRICAKFTSGRLEKFFIEN